MGLFKKLSELLFSKEEQTNLDLTKITEKIESDKKLIDPNEEYDFCDFCNSPIINDSECRKFGGSIFHKNCFKQVKRQVTRNWSIK